MSTTVNEKNSKLLSTLSSNLNFINLDKLNLNDLKAALTFKDGKVNVRPFDIKYQDIKVTVGGTHGFDQVMNYDLKFDVPTKYLGSEVNNLIAKLTPADAKKVESIPVNALMTGSFSDPKVSTDLKTATTNLVTQLVKQQKDKLVGQGTSALSNLIDKNKKSGDSTKTVIPTTKEEVNTKIDEAKEKAKEDLKNKAKDGLKDLFNKKKKDE